jgi:hypothetical protein
VIARVVITCLLVAAAPFGAYAQQRPLATEDPEVIGHGRVLVEAGVESGSNVKYPVSGLTGDRWALPVGLSLGFGSSVELQIDTGYQWLDIEHRDLAPLDGRVRAGSSTSDVIDTVVATKIRVLAEGRRRPAIGLRLAAELPNASNESGMGLDTLNFGGALLVAKSFGGTRVAANAGAVVLSDVLQGSLQHDAFTGNVSVVQRLTPGVDVAGEFWMRKVLFADVPPIGAEPRGQFRAAARYTRGAWRFDGGVIIGATRQDPDFGISAGVTWVSARP